MVDVRPVHDPDDVVEVTTASDRRPRVPGRGQLVQHLADREVCAEREDRAPRHHHLAQQPGVEVQGAAEDLSLLLVERLLAGDQVLEFLTRHLRLRGVRAHPGEADHEVARRAQHPHQGAGDPGQHVDGADGDHGPRQGALHGDAFGRQLTEHERDHGEDRRDEGDGDGLGRTAQHGQVGHEWRGQGHRGGRGRQEPGKRDADLDGGQEAVRVAGEGDEAFAPRGAITFELGQLALAQGDQGHLAAREGGVDQHEHPHEAEVQPQPVHGVTREDRSGCRGGGWGFMVFRRRGRGCGDNVGACPRVPVASGGVEGPGDPQPGRTYRPSTRTMSYSVSGVAAVVKRALTAYSRDP